MAATAAALMTGKAKYVLTGLKLMKAGPLLSMLATTVTYSFIFGYPYAAGMVGQTVIHEAGHAIALRYYGIPFHPMVIIPFVGGAVAMKELPRDAWQDAVIGISGPIAGGGAALAISAAAGSADSQLLYALADYGYLVNLFNLLPLGTMDGGRVVGAMHPNLGLLGVAGGGYLAYAGAISNPIFYLLLLSGGYTSGKRLLGYETAPPGYYNIHPGKRAVLGFGYIGLVAALLGGMAMNDRSRKTPKQLGYKGATFEGGDEDFVFDSGR